MEQEKQQEQSQHKLPENFDFNAYKVEATKNDIASIKKVMKVKWFENIPVIGSTIYSVRMRYHLSGIDRGVLRKGITKWTLIFYFSFLIYGYLLVAIITPYWEKMIISKGIKEAEKNIGQ